MLDRDSDYPGDNSEMQNSSTKRLASIPDKYSPDFAERLDKRTSIARAICGRIEAIETDLGGADGLSHARRSLIRRVVWMEAVIEHTEQRLAAGEGIDLGAHVQAVNSLIGLFRLLGLERRAKPARTLREIMAESPSDEPEPLPAESGQADTAGEKSAAPEPSNAATEGAP